MKGGIILTIQEGSQGLGKLTSISLNSETSDSKGFYPLWYATGSSILFTKIKF